MRKLLINLRWQFVALVLGWGCCVSSGCQSAGQLPVTKQGQPSYDKAFVVYEMDALQRPLPLTENAGQTSGPDALPPLLTESTHWVRAALSIQYPHPNGQLDLARATLRLSTLPEDEVRAVDQAGQHLGVDLLATKAFESSRSPAESSRDDELWVLDLPRQQLDLLLADLQHEGFFLPQSRAQLGTKLEVQVDHSRLRKEWSPEPRLDQFVLRVYREGQLSGLVSRFDVPDVTHLAGR